MKPLTKYISLLLFGGLIICFFINLRFQKTPPADMPATGHPQTVAIRQNPDASVFPIYSKVIPGLFTH